MFTCPNTICGTQIVGKGRLCVTSFFYKYETSTTYPLYETTQHFILKNDWCLWVQSTLPTTRLYPQSGYNQKIYSIKLCNAEPQQLDMHLTTPYFVLCLIFVHIGFSTLYMPDSVTRFTKILPLWQNFNNLCVIYQSIFIIWKNVKPPFGTF